MSDQEAEQLALVRAGARRGRRAKPARTPAERLPVARVALDVSLAHLDRPFDYLVPAGDDERCVPGCRVRARLAGALVDGYVLERVERSEHAGRLAYLDRVVSAEPVLAPEIADLARHIADRYAGTLADVLRLAVPPRHAKVEAEEGAHPSPPPSTPATSGWMAYARGDAFLRALADGRTARAVWDALPGEDWPSLVAAAAGTSNAAGRGALVVVPDQRDLARVGDALERTVGPSGYVTLTADLGPAERYRRWLAICRGTVRVVAGTRAAMFAPVTDLGLVVCWDDGDDLHSEPRAPYPHVREVLCLRSHLQGAAVFVGGYARTPEAAQLVRTGWAHTIGADRATTRARMPAVRPSGDDAELARDAAARSARLPHLAWQTAKDALAHGPVLVQTPRRGYVPSLACSSCRATARCRNCGGPLAAHRGGDAQPSCGWCGQLAAGWRCPSCGGGNLRAIVVGAARTAEELGRAFPGVAVRMSGGDATVLTEVANRPELVVATPGAEPVAAEGYAAALLLDGWALLGRADLRAGEETLRRWANACALVRSGTAGGRVVVLADAALRPVQALVRWDPAGFAERELAERAELRFPPAARAAAVTGSLEAVEAAVATDALPPHADVLGPVPVERAEDTARAVVRVPRRDGPALARALRAAQAVRSANKTGGQLRVQIDPLDVL
ncbi:MAG: primosomal protein N' [Streptosporangiales bacterium]